MLRLRVNHYVVLLSPDRVAWYRYDWLGRLTAHDVLASEPATQGRLWDSTKKLVAKFFSSFEGAASATIVLSNHFARFVTVPWQSGLQDAEWQEYARQLFVAVYGDVAGQWDIRVSGIPAGRSRLACAIDGALLEELLLVVQDTKVKIKSVQPLYMDAFNRLRHLVSEQDAWFVTVDSGKLCAGLMAGQEWKRIRCQLIGKDMLAELNNLLEQESLMLGEAGDPAPVYLYAPDHVAQLPPEASRWKIRRLSDMNVRRGSFTNRLMGSKAVTV